MHVTISDAISLGAQWGAFLERGRGSLVAAKDELVGPRKHFTIDGDDILVR